MRALSTGLRLFAATALVVLAGCITSGVKVDQNRLAELKPGVTTYSDVISMFGPPTNSALSSDGTRTVQYAYVHAQANAASFIPYVGLLAGGSTSEDTTVTFNFSAKGVLTTYSSSQGSNAVGTGIISGQRQ